MEATAYQEGVGPFEITASLISFYMEATAEFMLQVDAADLCS